MTPEGCVFRSCGRGEALDLTTGSCVPQAGLAGLPSVLRAGACPEGTSAVATVGRLACLDAEATCPRGTRLDSSSKRPICARPPQCPPGTLPDGRGPLIPTVAPTCRPIVSVGPDGRRSVDVGGWAALVLGVDGGPGTDDLCRPLLQRPDVFGLQPQPAAPAQDEEPDAGSSDADRAQADAGAAGAASAAGAVGGVRLLIWLTFPDQDIARVHARGIQASASRGPSGTEAEANRLVTEAVETLLEPLRGLGGEASAAEARVEVRCGPSAKRR
jgi:hypothetical protein